VLAGVTPSWWSPVTWIPVKRDPEGGEAGGGELRSNIIQLYENQTPTVMIMVETSRASPEMGIPSTWVVNAFLGPRVAA